MPTATRCESVKAKRYTLGINRPGWDEACRRRGLYGDTAIAAHLGVSYVTLYRVLTGRLAPGPTFIAHATLRLGSYDQLFTQVEVQAAA